MARRAFVAFSGGGAKGIVHVGALKALEERDVSFAGLSGTSAGSIVAALAAAGFKSDELFDSYSGNSIFSVLSKIDANLNCATDIFGSNGWRRIEFFRWFLRRKIPMPLLIACAWALPALLMLVSWLTLPQLAMVMFPLIWISFGLCIWLAYRTVIGGLATARQFRDALDLLLRTKVFPDEPERMVTMGDFGIDGRPPLKIVSANLTERRLHLFSAERSPDVPVADAVAASICLPVIFSPWRIGGDLHIDGGIVSNLPAWAFDEERELDPEALTIAVETKETRDPITLDAYSWLPAAIRTMLSGSAELNIRAAGHVEQIQLSTNLDLLDFDVSKEMAAQEVRQISAIAGMRLDKRLFRLPQIYRDACQVAMTIAADGFGIAPNGRGQQPRIRVAVGRLERGYVRSLRLSHAVGFDGDPDEFMLLPLEGSVGGAAWRLGQSQLELFSDGSPKDLPGTTNRLRRSRRWPDLTWVMAIPILDGESGIPRLLVQLEGNFPLREDAEMSATLEGVEEAVKTFFILVLEELRELEDSYGY